MGKRIGARALDAVVCLVLFVVPLLLVSPDRVLARLTVGFAVVVAYETLCVVAFGATPGKQITGIRVSPVEQTAMTPQIALRRAMLAAFATMAVTWLPLVVVGNTGSGDGNRLGVGITFSIVASFVGLCMVISTLSSPLRRGVPDRTAETVVLDRAAPADFGARQLAERAAAVRAPVQTNPAGPPAPFDRRRRARASRLDGAPVLVLLILALGFLLSVPSPSGWLVGLVGLAWVVAFVADETWRISRHGATAGHRRFGLAVVDRTTGEAPSPLASATRAILVALPLYVLPTLVIAGLVVGSDHTWMLFVSGASALLVVVWLVVLRFLPGRSLHDLAAHTNVVVVAEPQER